MLKTLLALCGVLVVSATGLKAQNSRSYADHASAAARPSAYRGYNHYSGGGSYGGRHGGNWGRYYYLGGVPYFYPFGYGFGYPYYSGGFYGDFGGYGYGGSPENDNASNGRATDGDNGTSGQAAGGSLPEAVQRQLAKRGYYKGTVDGQFGQESRNALSRFQKKQGLKETGKIDEPTLEALGFTDRH